MTGSEKYGHALPLDVRSGQLAVMRADYRKR
jgi:hypothetical protein